MQLIIGGMGFVGLHTARALLDLGQECVLTRYRIVREPSFIKGEIGRRLFVEQVDAGDLESLRELGRRRRITGIIYLANGAVRGDGYPEALQRLFNLLAVAAEWKVARIALASTIGVYAGVASDGPLREELPLPMAAFHPIPSFMKISELLAPTVASGSDVEVIHFRYGAWGPLSHHPPSPMNIPVQMVRAAVVGVRLDFSAPQSRAFAEDGADYCYVRDCGRAIARLQIATKLNHAVYNIGMGRAVTNREFAAAVRAVIPGAEVEPPAGFDPRGPRRTIELDLSRIRADAGYEPEYDLERGVADYVAWLRAGNEE